MAHRPHLALYLFENKVLSEHSYTCKFKFCPWLLSCYKAEMDSCDRDRMTHKAKKMCYLDLCRQSLLTSPLGHPRESVKEAAGYSATYGKVSYLSVKWAIAWCPGHPLSL